MATKKAPKKAVKTAAKKTTEAPAASSATEVRRIKDLAEKTTDTNWLDPHMIKYEKGFNPRDYRLPENREHLDNLKASIKSQGVLVPLLVRYEGSTKEAILVDGECRLRACLELLKEGVDSIKRIPTVQVKGGNDEKGRLMIAILANEGKPFSEIEFGAAFRRLDKFGMTLEEISEQTGKKVAFIKKCMELDEAPEQLKKLVSKNEVTPALALASIKKVGATAAAKQLAKQVEKKKAAGQKGPLKVEKKAKPTNTPKGVAHSDIEKAARALLAGAAGDIKEAEEGNYEYASVSLPLLKRLQKAFDKAMEAAK